jgi:hypothetical protein
MSLIITKKNDQYVTVPRLRFKTTGLYLNAATVIATLYDRANATKWKTNPSDGTIVAVTGLDHVVGVYNGGADGTYNIPIGNAFDPPKGGGYLLIVTALQAGSKLEIELNVSIHVRKS